MKKPNALRLLLLIISCVFLTSCSPKIPDVFVFESLEQRLSTDPMSGHLILSPSPTCMKQIKEVSCGHGVKIVSGEEIFVGEITLYAGKKWSELKAESIYVPAKESYAPLSAYIINSCKKMNCDSQVDAFKVKLDSLNGISGAMKNP